MKWRTEVAPVVTRTDPVSPQASSPSRRSARPRPVMPSWDALRSARPSDVGATPRGASS
ncbi:MULTISPECIES: hypothetical protein [unclassified Streptomyces]|uniref:hypothetical protein n=1 Tax=unclassified Streptomyces TaxID=2593676 RepID=UPI001F473D7E|nr:MULTISPECIES: hypothetical protein [unclassified Streptomyces]